MKQPERKSPMPERKFAALAGIKKATQPKQMDVSPPPTVSTSPEVSEAKGRGRPAGKRSNPSYEPTTLLLRKETKKKASRLLEDIGSRQDLSDLAEHLLSRWIEQQTT
jgi:hypothetical protein